MVRIMHVVVLGAPKVGKTCILKQLALMEERCCDDVSFGGI